MNNFLPNRPPLMNDGRNFSSWQPEAVINKRIQEDASITSNWQYRQYMQQNGVKIMQFNAMQAEHDTGTDVNLKFDNSKGSNPYVYKSVFDSSKPYQMSELKAPYMSREQLNARMVAPTIQHN